MLSYLFMYIYTYPNIYEDLIMLNHYCHALQPKIYVLFLAQTKQVGPIPNDKKYTFQFPIQIENFSKLSLKTKVRENSSRNGHYFYPQRTRVLDVGGAGMEHHSQQAALQLHDGNQQLTGGADVAQPRQHLTSILDTTNTVSTERLLFF